MSSSAEQNVMCTCRTTQQTQSEVEYVWAKGSTGTRTRERRPLTYSRKKVGTRFLANIRKVDPEGQEQIPEIGKVH